MEPPEMGTQATAQAEPFKRPGPSPSVVARWKRGLALGRKYEGGGIQKSESMKMAATNKLDKGKAKTLATASTLQKVVCPAPERDPQEILSIGRRKVGEQKRVTNRLANGHPDHGVGYTTRNSSFAETAGHQKRQNGRQVLDKMFGHMRPHHIVTPTVVLRSEEQELENGLSCQAARAAFFRPVIGPALNELAASQQQSPAEALGVGGSTSGAGTGGGGTAVSSSSRVHDGGPRSAPQVPVSVPKGHHGPDGGSDSVGAAEMGGGGEGGDNSWLSTPLRAYGSSSPLSSPSFTRRHGPGSLTAALGVMRQDGSLHRAGSGKCSPCRNGGGGSGSGGSGDSSSTHITIPNGLGSSPRTGVGVPERRVALPAVIRSYPSDSDSAVPALSAVSFSDAPRLPAAAGAIGGGGGATPRRHHRASVSGGDLALPAIGPTGCSGAAATAVNGGGKFFAGRRRRASLTGGGLSTSSIPGQLRRTSMTGAIGGGGGDGNHAGGGGRVDLQESPNSLGSHQHLSEGSSGQMNLNLNGSFRTGGGGVAAAPPASAQMSATAMDLSNGGPPGSSGGGGAISPAAAVNPAVPLSGLENLAGTGLGDAISQLRNIRMGGVAPPAKERKAEPGLAGVVPLQLLPVTLPPVDSWQVGARQTTDLDPCKGIRLVDAATCVLPRPTAEANLQVRMAQHQAAMRHLVKAEGAPMSEIEMEAAKLLGRLERSGARHRNLDVGEVDNKEQQKSTDLEDVGQ